MKKYELLKDLPHAKAGTIFEGTDDGMVNTFQYATSTKDTYYLHRYMHPEWIKEVEQEKICKHTKLIVDTSPGSHIKICFDCNKDLTKYEFNLDTCAEEENVEEKLCGCTVCCANRVEIKEERLPHTECQKGRNCPDCAEEREERQKQILDQWDLRIIQRQKELYQHVHTEDCICSKTSPIGEPVEEQEKEEFPKVGENYYFIDAQGESDVCESEGDKYDVYRKNAANVFPTREAAEAELTLRKLQAKRWKPKQNDMYWYYDTYYKNAKIEKFTQWQENICEFLLGNCFPDTLEGKKQCEAYGKQLQKVIDFLLDNK